MSAQTTTEAAIDPRLLKAFSHPLRQRILVALNERVASPSDLARDLGERLGNVSYHVKILLECDAIELVRTEPVRGAVEHFYRANTRVQLDDASWAMLPASVRREIFDKTLQEIWDHLTDAAGQGGLDDDRTHVSWMPLDLDDAGYEEAIELLAGTLDELIEIQARATGRAAQRNAADEPATEHRTEVAMIHFHRARDGELTRRRGKR